MGNEVCDPSSITEYSNVRMNLSSHLSDCLLIHHRTLCNSPKISSSWWSTLLWPPIKANGPALLAWSEQWGCQLYSWIKNVFKHKQISLYVLMTTTYALGCSIPVSLSSFLGPVTLKSLSPLAWNVNPWWRQNMLFNKNMMRWNCPLHVHHNEQTTRLIMCLHWQLKTREM